MLRLTVLFTLCFGVLLSAQNPLLDVSMINCQDDSTFYATNESGDDELTQIIVGSRFKMLSIESDQDSVHRLREIEDINFSLKYPELRYVYLYNIPRIDRQKLKFYTVCSDTFEYDYLYQVNESAYIDIFLVNAINDNDIENFDISFSSNSKFENDIIRSTLYVKSAKKICLTSIEVIDSDGNILSERFADCSSPGQYNFAIDKKSSAKDTLQYYFKISDAFEKKYRFPYDTGAFFRAPLREYLLHFLFYDKIIDITTFYPQKDTYSIYELESKFKSPRAFRCFPYDRYVLAPDQDNLSFASRLVPMRKDWTTVEKVSLSKNFWHKHPLSRLTWHLVGMSYGSFLYARSIDDSYISNLENNIWYLLPAVPGAIRFCGLSSCFTNRWKNDNPLIDDWFDPFFLCLESGFFLADWLIDGKVNAFGSIKEKKPLNAAPGLPEPFGGGAYLPIQVKVNF